jgi:NAD(P)H-hydrate epimerase
MPLYLTREQVREVDRLAVERYAVPGIVLMENAALGAARLALAMLRRCASRKALIVCGGGNNGGDGMAIARHLHNAGVQVLLATTVNPLSYKGDAAVNFQIARKMGLSIDGADAEFIANFKRGLIIDAIFGTGLAEPPRWNFQVFVDAITASGSPVLAVDLPSGLDCDSGEPLGCAVTATRTATFVGLKAGFANPASRRYTGAVSVVSIGAPVDLIREVTAPLRLHIDRPDTRSG